jgi:archaetidylinositol phosphate synthase
MPETAFLDARREMPSLTARLEKKVLLWLAARMPAWVSSDQLTLLGLLGLVGAGASYALSARQAAWLHVVNLLVAVNWFGDSLDGTLARFRQRARPRYGFYVDHMVDTVGVLFLLGGLALSTYMSPAVAVANLLLYYMLTINICLASYTLGVNQMAYARMGGTEMRMLLILGNLAVLLVPRVTVFGRSALLYDLFGSAVAAGLAWVLALSCLRNARALSRLERPAPA